MKDPILIHSKIQGPRHSSDGQDVTLRDLFAAFALAGDLSRGHGSSEQMAIWCYKYADAMLAEREKTK